MCHNIQCCTNQSINKLPWSCILIYNKCTNHLCENSLTYLFVSVFLMWFHLCDSFTGHLFMFYIFTQCTQLNTVLYLSGLMAAILNKNQLSSFTGDFQLTSFTGDLSKLCTQILQKIKIEAKFFYLRNLYFWDYLKVEILETTFRSRFRFRF